ncbi:MAG: YeiH family protein [Oscillospiraceae bacterium]|nr:YeiH family protein [Oscillospiraceae bacterium]
MILLKKDQLPGILLCAVLTVPAWILGQLVPVVGGPVFAILLGIILALTPFPHEKFNAGISFVSKKLLQLAVILLGFGMNLNTVFEIGLQSLPIIIATISTSLIVAYIMSKLLHSSRNTSVLIGVGSSICGGSAIAATAPVIGADDDEIAQSISVIFLFNVVAALLFPTLGDAIGLSNEGFGLFAGTAVNDTSSVTAAASAWDDIHGSNVLDTAVVVKLTRTLAIIPITLALGIYQAKTSSESRGKIKLSSILPFFIILFVVCSVITTAATALGIPAAFFSPFKTASKVLIVMAMTAIGLNTDLKKIIKTGKSPILMGLCCWAAIAAVSLAMQRALGIW